MNNRLSYSMMLVFLLASAGVAQYLTRSGDRELIPSRESLFKFPEQFDQWRQYDSQSLGAGQIKELSADDYLVRTYINNEGWPAYLFIAYYQSQRHRQTLHSPQNCIPGSGWTMGAHRLHSLEAGQGGDPRQINEYLIEKDEVKMLAFYWYQGRNRVIASDYWGRIYTVKDAILLGRTDGALIRIIIPMTKSDDAEEIARSAGINFARNIMPMLPAYVPD